MSIELKIKSKHLALEPLIIRQEEEKLNRRINYLKTKGEDTDALTFKMSSLIRHRLHDVKNASRATNLARTFLAGKPYTYAERKRKTEKEEMFQTTIIPRITAMIKKYGGSSYFNAEDKLIQEWSKL